MKIEGYEIALTEDELDEIIEKKTRQIKLIDKDFFIYYYINI